MQLYTRENLVYEISVVRIMSWEAIHRWATKWLPTVASVVVILGAIFAGIRYIVKSEIEGMGTSIQRIDDAIRPLPDAISSLKDRATKMETHWDDLKIRDLSQRSSSKQNIDAIKQTLAEAKEANLKLSPDTIREAGNRFLLTAGKDRIAWNAALAFLDYRSFLNAGHAPNVKDFIPLPDPTRVSWDYSLTLNPATVHILIKAGKHVPRERAAVMELIEHPLNVGRPVGHEYLLLDGPGSLPLDGYRLKNVIFRGTTISYKGGPVDMDHVYFVDCTFDFPFTPNGLHLSNEILTSVATSFKPVG